MTKQKTLNKALMLQFCEPVHILLPVSIYESMNTA